MKLKRIYIENYKTYRKLDLNLEVTSDRPIILIGGAKVVVKLRSSMPSILHSMD